MSARTTMVRDSITRNPVGTGASGGVPDVRGLMAQPS